MIKVDLKGSEKEFESGVSVAEVAKSIGMGLYKSACAAKVNGEVCDLRTVLNEDCKVEILTFDDKEGKKAYWHTASHIMAQAVNRLYPGTKFAIGPAVDNGFYYDMELPQAITNDDLAKIEAEMKKIIKKGAKIEIIVKSVVDRRSDGQLCLRIELLYRLGENMRSRVAERMSALFIGKLQNFQRTVSGEHILQSPDLSVYLCGHCFFRQSAADALRRIQHTASVFHLPDTSVCQCYLNHRKNPPSSNAVRKNSSTLNVYLFHYIPFLLFVNETRSSANTACGDEISTNLPHFLTLIRQSHPIRATSSFTLCPTSSAPYTALPATAISTPAAETSAIFPRPTPPSISISKV